EQEKCTECGDELFYEDIRDLVPGRHHVHDRETCLRNQRDALAARVQELEEERYFFAAKLCTEIRDKAVDATIACFNAEKQGEFPSLMSLRGMLKDTPPIEKTDGFFSEM